MSRNDSAADSAGQAPRFPTGLMHSVATMYYVEDINQAEIAKRLGTSRATVSRLLSEARRHGIVRIEVVAPAQPDDAGLSRQVERALGLRRVYLSAQSSRRLATAALAVPVFTALREAGLKAGDVLLLSSGRVIYEITQADMPALPGISVAPMIGGQDEPEIWYQTNEIARQFAAKVGGQPSFLFAPALPGAELHRSLREEPSIRRVLEQWRTARCAVLGIGGPLETRDSLPQFLPVDAAPLQAAVGDIASRFYDRDGAPVLFEGSDRLMSTELDVLCQIPVSIAVAIGEEKVAAIAAGARSGYFNHLVTNPSTATALLRYALSAPS